MFIYMYVHIHNILQKTIKYLTLNNKEKIRQNVRQGKHKSVMNKQYSQSNLLLNIQIDQYGGP